MEIAIKVDNITTFTKALNNAIIAYNDVVSAIMFGCDVPKKLKPLESVDDEELKKRINCLADVYEQVENIEISM